MKTNNSIIITVAATLIAATAFVQSAAAQWMSIGQSMTCLTRMGDILFGANEWDSHVIVARSTDEGNTWVQYPGGDTLATTALGTQGTILYAGTWNRGIYRSLDSGKTWLSADSMGSYSSITAFASTGTTLFAAALGSTSSSLLRSEDSGRRWQEVNVGSLVGPINSILIKDSSIYISDRNGSGSISRDLGTTWEDINLLNPSLLCLKGQYLLAVCGDAAIYRSSDSGASWNQLALTDQISEAGISWLMPVDSELLLCTQDQYHSQIYRSFNNGETWMNYSQGISGYAEFEQMIVMDHYVVAVGVLDNQSYRRPITDFAAVSRPSSTSGILVGSITTLQHGVAGEILPLDHSQSVSLYDVLGRVRAEVSLPAGASAFGFDRIDAGLYFLRTNGRTTKIVIGGG